MKKMRLFYLVMGFVFLFFQGSTSFAANTVNRTTENANIIKVGYFDYQGFIEQDEKGNYFGYGVDYLKEVCKYTGWEVQYEYDTLENCVEKLNNHDIDLLFSAQLHEENKELFDLSENPMGYEYGVMYVSDGSEIYYDDYNSFNGMNIGFLDGSCQHEKFSSFADGKFQYNANDYKTMDELINALDSNEISGIVLSSLSPVNNLKLVCRFSADSFSMLTHDENEEVMNQFNHAITEIRCYDPLFEANLYKKYYSNDETGSIPVFNSEEVNYIEEHNIIKLGFLSDNFPYTYVDDNNCASGIIVSLTDKISELIGVKFEYIPLSSREELIESCLHGEIDGYFDAKSTEDSSTNKHTEAIYSTEIATIRNGSKKDSYTVVADYSLKPYSLFIEQQFQITDIEYVENAEKCIELINNNEADTAILSGFYINKLNSAKSDGKSIINPTTVSTMNLSVYFSDGVSDVVVDVINKGISLLRDFDVNYAVQKVQQETKNEVGSTATFDIFSKSNEVIILELLLIVFVIVLFVGNKYFRNISKLKYVDQLTNCYNLNYFKKVAPKILEDNGIDGYCVVKFDIFRFKYINQYYGWNVGDQVLKKLADIFKSAMESNELLARVSDDVFVALVNMNNPGRDTTTKQLYYYMESIRTELKIDIKLTIKSGIYKVADESEEITFMIDKATVAEKSIKDNPKVDYAVYNKQIEDKIKNESEIEIAMEMALSNSEFKVYLQPKTDLYSLKTVGAEALIRWIKPDGTQIYPDEFIPFFEKNGFIEKLDLYVLEEVCKYLTVRKKDGKKCFPISVKQSRYLICNPNYISKIYEIIDKYEMDSSLIEFELTESLYIENKELLFYAIDKIHSLDIKLSIDDFGSGYSSLNLITEIPADVLKIDREFLTDSANKQVKKDVIDNVVNLAHKLNMLVVCEGVESYEQQEFLKTIKCDLAQGFFYSKPLPISDFEKYVEKTS